MSALVPYLVTAGPVVMAALIVRASARSISLLVAVIAGVCSKDVDRRNVCLEMVRALCTGWFQGKRGP
jgi:hypothetical protein